MPVTRALLYEMAGVCNNKSNYRAHLPDSSPSLRGKNSDGYVLIFQVRKRSTWRLRACALADYTAVDERADERGLS